MATGKRCTKYFTNLCYGGLCYGCLVAVGGQPESMETAVSSQPANIYNSIPPASQLLQPYLPTAQPFQAPVQSQQAPKPTLQAPLPSQKTLQAPLSSQKTLQAPLQQIFQAPQNLQPPMQASQQLFQISQQPFVAPAIVSPLPNQPNPDCAGSKAYFWSVGKAKCKKTPATVSTPY
ncbi:hypothetical protein PTTG_02391, partial [Puccinia triticina 1-1 BBBD Race 1]